MVIPHDTGELLGHNSIVVVRNSDFGYWQVNVEKGVANLRKMNINVLPDTYGLLTKTHYYSIMEFLKDELKFRNVKEVIPDRKVIFSHQAICQIPNCKNEAQFIMDGQKLCSVHSNIQIN